MTDQEWQALKKRNHICRDCGKQDAYTFSGHTYCYECNEKRNQRARDLRKVKGDEMNRRRRELRAQRVAEHKCVTCGKDLPMQSTKRRCPTCLARNMVNKRKWYWKTHEPKVIGVMCRQCGAPVLEGKKLCPVHYTDRLARLEKAWTANRAKKEESKCLTGRK